MLSLQSSFFLVFGICIFLCVQYFFRNLKIYFIPISSVSSFSVIEDFKISFFKCRVSFPEESIGSFLIISFFFFSGIQIRAQSFHQYTMKKNTFSFFLDFRYKNFAIYIFFVGFLFPWNQECLKILFLKIFVSIGILFSCNTFLRNVLVYTFEPSQSVCP